MPVRDENLGCITRRRCTYVSYHVSETHVSFMPHAHKRRNPACGDFAHKWLVVKRAEIISTTSPTDNHQYFRQFGQFIEIFDCPDHLIRSVHALHLDMRDVNTHTSPAIIHDFDKVRIPCCLRTANHTDMRRNCRETSFALLGKQPLTLELRPKHFKAFLDAPLATRPNRLHSQAEFAPWCQFGNRRHDHPHAIFDRNTELPHCHETADARIIVFEVKKHELVLIDLKRSYLAFDTDGGIRIF